MKSIVARGNRNAIVAGHPLAADVAARVLGDGGNVVDAAVAGAAVLAVVLPHACSLGGDCFALVRTGGRTHGLNGSGRSPARLPLDVPREALEAGPMSTAVPGVLGGWEAMHARFGRLPWSSVLAPAESLARDGVPVSAEVARATARWREPLARDPGCAALFLDDGAPYGAGHLLRQPALAETLAAAASDGAGALYEGDAGARLAASVRAAGGVLAPSDLAAYRPEWVEPLERTYRGHRVQVMPPNSWGLYMLMQLAALDETPLGELSPGSPEALAPLVRAARAAFRLGSRLVADPGAVDGAAGGALGPELARELVAAVAGAPVAGGEPVRTDGTAVISVADGDGDGITIVESVFTPFGALVACPATGIVMNNRLRGFARDPDHPNAPGPGKRPAHTLNPVLVLAGDRPRWLMGTPGGSGQTITLTQVLSHLVDRGMDLAAAVSAPRWSMDLAGEVLLEPELGPDAAGGLAGLGIEARTETGPRTFFGSAECIEIGDDGLTAVADFRRDAGAAGA